MAYRAVGQGACEHRCVGSERDHHRPGNGHDPEAAVPRGRTMHKENEAWRASMKFFGDIAARLRTITHASDDATGPNATLPSTRLGVEGNVIRCSGPRTRSAGG